MRPPNLQDILAIESPDTRQPHCFLDGFALVSGLTEVFIESSRLGLLALGQNSEAVQGPDNLTHRSLGIQPASSGHETPKKRKETNHASPNFCQRFCVMDAPEIYQSPAVVVVSEFLPAVQTSDVGFSAINRSVSGPVGRDCFAQSDRRTLVPVRAEKNKTKQCPYKQRGA
jgi:hypothetical protein